MMLQPRPTTTSTQARTPLRMALTVGACALVMVGSVRLVDAEQAQGAGARGGLLELMFGHHPDTAPSPWDFTRNAPLPVCYQVQKGTGTAADPCDINPGRGFVPSPWDVHGAPLVRLKPGASCPADVPDWATCDSARPDFPAPDPAPSPDPSPAGSQP